MRKVKLFLLMITLVFFVNFNIFAENKIEEVSGANSADVSESLDENSDKHENDLSTKSSPSDLDENNQNKSADSKTKETDNSEINQASANENSEANDLENNSKNNESSPLENRLLNQVSAPLKEEGAKPGDEDKNSSETEKNKAPNSSKNSSNTEAKDQVDAKTNEELKKLQEKIDSAKDEQEKKKIQNEYNKKLFEEIEKSASDKFNKEVLYRFKDKTKTKEFYEIQEQYEILKKKSKDGKLTIDELEKFNKKVGSFYVPRKLDDDEKTVQEELNESLDVPRLREGATKDAQDKLEAYNNAKKALLEALDTDKDRQKSKEELQKLLDDFKKAQQALKDGIAKGDILPAYTYVSPEVRVVPIDGSGKLGTEIKGDKDDIYYIPEDTNLNLLISVNKDDEPKEFTFKIKAIEKGAILPKVSAKNLAFLNGEPVALIENEDGSYSFTVDSNNINFGIAQLRFNIPGFQGDFHKGFDLEMDMGNKNVVTKKFRLTKKGYEDAANLSGPGIDSDKNPKAIPEIDGGKTDKGVINEDTDKVYDFFTYLKKSNTYIDDVIVNSPNGKSLPLSSVDITIKVPKSKNEFAKMIHKSGLKYDDLGNGEYRLKLDAKVFGENLVEKDGKLYLKGNDGKPTEELTPAQLQDVILEGLGKKVYIDENGISHDLIVTESYLSKDNSFKVQGSDLYKKNSNGKYDKIGTFTDGKLLVKENIGGKETEITYILKGNKLISYTKIYDVYKGNVVNVYDKANSDLTGTVNGKQVTIKTEVTDDKGKKIIEISYGGTIVKNAIFDKKGKIFTEKGYKGILGEVAIGPDGKEADGLIFTPESINEENNTVEVLGKIYRIVKNPVFKDGYIVDGLEYKGGLSLVDKFGKIMKVEVSEKNGTYTFTKLDKEGKATDKKVSSDGNKIIVSDKEEQIVVDSKNQVIDNAGQKIIGNKYYYDGNKFWEADEKNIKGNKFFENLKEFVLDKISSYSYKDGDKNVEIKDFDKKTVYQGSLKPEDYFKVDEKIYLKKAHDNGDYYVSCDAKSSDEILSVNKIVKIVQTLKKDGQDIEKITDQTDIFSAVENAKFSLKFPGFLTGKNIVYNVHADVKASYLAPKLSKEDEWEEKSIFTSEKDGIKKIDKFFTLKNEKVSNTTFFKNAPSELLNKPDINFFNIFYRDLTDRDRDKLITDLLQIKAEEDAKAEKAKENTGNTGNTEGNNKLSDEEKKAQKETKAKLELLEKLQKELGRLYDGASFVAIKNAKGEITGFEIQRKGKKVEIDRSLLWEIGFNNHEGTLFPENKDAEIIIEDHNMDNRLVYDEIILNDTKEKWDGYKKAYEEAKKVYDAAKKADEKSSNDKTKKALEDAEKALEKVKFQGNDQYFSIDQIKDIRFGVNPNYVEGRFVPLGDNFKLTGEEILKKLGDNEKATINKDGFDITIIRDKKKGQIRIKVMDAFYKKNYSYNKDSEDNNYRFYSPAQKAYQDKMKDVISELDKLNSADTTEFQSSFENVVKKLHSESSYCFGVLKEKFKDLMAEVDKITDPTDKANKLNEIKETLKKEINKLNIGYLDSKKESYNNDDMRFNAIRIGLNPNITIGGAMNPQKTKKLGISSVIIPELDIPYTDEFGNLLTNKNMYVKEEMEKIFKDGISQGKESKKYSKDDLNDEEKFREIMAEAYSRVNEKINSTDKNKKIKVEDLVTVKEVNENKFAWEKYTVAKGSDLEYRDLAFNNEESIKDINNLPINPWYIGEGKNAKKVSKKLTGKLKDSDAYKTLENKEIDLAAYYMSEKGYDRNKYANAASYKLDMADKKPGIFGTESDWKKKVCYPGIGHCIEMAGKDILPGQDGQENKFGLEGQAKQEFELSYSPTTDKPDSENPKVDKKSDPDNVDISGEEDKKVDFTIDVTVDKMTKEQKDISEALKPKKSEEDMSEEEKAKAKAEKEAKEIEDKNYNSDGYYQYKNSLIIDILPDIFKLKVADKDASEIQFNADREKLMANGANKVFKDENTFTAWKAKVKYFYTDDLMGELEKLSKSSDENDKVKYEVLKKAIADGKASGKIKDGQKVQAVLAWLPDFEAPHGSENQFTFVLKNVYIDKKNYKDFSDGVIGTNYTNHAGFGDKARFYFASKTVNIHEGPSGNVNKYLQLLDKDGKVIDSETADGWFKGSAKLEFGDKFNYRIEYRKNSGIVNLPGQANYKINIGIEDILAQVKDKGLRPVLNGFVTSDLEGFEVIYKIQKGGKTTEYTEEELKKAIKENKAKLSEVTGLVLKSGRLGFPDNSTKNFYIPMMIPELDAKIENGNVVYIGRDGEKHDLGPAKDFFNLKDLTDKDKDLIAENKVDKSNTVSIYLEKNRFIKLFKEFFDANGEEIKKDRPQMKFEIYQIETDENGKEVKRVKLLDKNGNAVELTVNENNNFTDMVSNLPIFKKFVSVDEKGKVSEKIISYKYEIKEINSNGYDVEYKIIDSGKDELGFVFKVKNTLKPEKPPEKPPENPPGNPPGNPPDNPPGNPPDNPPENPPEEPNTPPEVPEKPLVSEEKPDTNDLFNKTSDYNNPNTIPKTGVEDNLLFVGLSGVLLILLMIFKKRYYQE